MYNILFNFVGHALWEKLIDVCLNYVVIFKEIFKVHKGKALSNKWMGFDFKYFLNDLWFQRFVSVIHIGYR